MAEWLLCGISKQKDSIGGMAKGTSSSSSAPKKEEMKMLTAKGCVCPLFGSTTKKAMRTTCATFALSKCAREVGVLANIVGENYKAFFLFVAESLNKKPKNNDELKVFKLKL